MTPPTPRTALALLASLALAACGGIDHVAPPPPASGDGPRLSTQLEPVEHRQLYLPAEDSYVLQLDADADPEIVADELGVQLLEVLANGQVLVQGSMDPGTATGNDDISVAEPNLPALLGDAQDLVFGYNEEIYDPGAIAAQDAIASLELERLPESIDGAGITVAILDTGADPDHPLYSRQLRLLGDNHPLGSIAVAEGEDEDGDGDIDEGVHHGTHVAGIVAQVAPKATIFPVRVLNSDGFGSLFDILAGLELCLQQADGIDVVNLSLRLGAHSPLMEEACRRLQEAGVLVVAAAGNVYGEPAAWPALYPSVLGVGATDNADSVAVFSAVGPLVSVGAPGTQVLSAIPGGMMAELSGTSMACPIVSAASALLLQAGPVAPGEIERTFMEHAGLLHPTGATASGRLRIVPAFEKLLGPQLPSRPGGRELHAP